MLAATMTRMVTDVDAPGPWLAGAWSPWEARNPTRANQKMTFRTTADPMPWVPRAKPVSAPLTPAWV